MEKPIILGVSGEAGSFSEEAGYRYVQQAGIQATLEFLTDMEGVLSAVSAGSVDLGIFPVFNSIGGLVTMAFESMGKYLFTFLAELPLSVNQCLMVRPGVQVQQINVIVSHPQGLAQCRQYLQRHLPTAGLIAWQDTAKAARDLAQGRLDAHGAVIASKRAAEIYGLNVVAENIQDHTQNITTFIIVEKRSI